MTKSKAPVEEEFGWGFPAEGFTWPDVEREGDLVELVLGEEAEVVSFGEVLAEQTVGVSVDSSLPRAVEVGEVDFESYLLGEGGVLGHLAALVVGQREANLGVEAIEDAGDVLRRRFGASIFKTQEGDEEGGAFDQGTDARLVEFPW